MSHSKTIIFGLLVVVFVIFRVAACTSSGGSNEQVLYGRVSNRVTDMGSAKKGCKQLGFYTFEGGGIVDTGGKNKNLDIEKYLMTLPKAKKHKDYFYINAKSLHHLIHLFWIHTTRHH